MVSRLVALTLLAAPFAAAPKKPGPVLITFKEGAYTATVQGSIPKRSSFEFYAVKGELLVVNIIPVSKDLATSGLVTYPSGKTEGSHGGVVDSDVITETGKFRVDVGLNTMADTVNHGEFRLELIRYPAGLIPQASTH